MVKYDGTVRTGTNIILQFVFGDSGIDTIKQRENPIKLIELNDDDIMKKYKFTETEGKYYDPKKYNNDAFSRDMLIMS